MTTPARTLQASEGDPLEAAVVVDALSAHFRVATGPREVIRTARLDTFDRRLRAAGVALELRSGATGDRLVLSRQGVGSTTVAQVAEMKWPALTSALPDGPLRDELAPVAGIRALIVISDEKRRVRRAELRNGDEKIVARVDLEEPVATSPPVPLEVTVRPLRGYDDQARRATGLLTALGLRPVEVREVAEPEVSPSVGMDRSTPAVRLLASTLSQFFEMMHDNLPGLLEDVDTEFLHDFRVAVRRTRSTLKLGRPVLPEVMRARWEPAFKWLGDLTTPVRDLDVYELDLPTMAGWLVAADAADLAPFAVLLRRRRAAERRALVRGLRSVKFQRLSTEWESALAELADAPPDGESGPSSGDLADLSISRAYRRVSRGGAAISADSPAESLHTLRKHCKELRYSLEVFAPVIDKSLRRRAVGDLKALQDVLGRFQDSEVQRQALRHFAEELMRDGTSATAVLAMGELIGHLDADQDRARSEFDIVFSRFVRPSSDRRMRRLGGGR